MLLMRTMKVELAEELKLRLGGTWQSEALSWEKATKQLKDILGITSHAVIQALLALSQHDATPAPEFVQKFDRVVQEVGELDETVAKSMLVGALNSRTKQGLNEGVHRYLKPDLEGTREDQWKAVSYLDVVRVLKSRDMFPGGGESVDVSSYVN